MVKAIFERDYKSIPFVTIVQAPPAPKESLSLSFDSMLFATPEHMPQHRHLDVNSDELKEYLMASPELAMVDPLKWWKVKLYIS